MDFKKSSETNLTNYTLYAGLVEWDSMKVFYLIFHILLTFIGPSLLYSIVWYERYSSDLRCRTLVNQLLSHISLLSMVGCVFGRIPYVSIFFIGPYSSTTCGIIIFIGRGMFLSILMELTIRQVIKYLYIFQWKNLVSLNDDFFAIYFTSCNLLLSIEFILVTHFLGFQNSEIDYHICTGKHPKDNIMETFYEVKRFTNPNEIPITLNEIANRDPLFIFTLLLFLILFLVGFQTWLYSHKDSLIICWKAVTRTNLNTTSNLNINKTQGYKNNKFEETKNVIIGSSGTLFSIVLIFLLLSPAVVAKSFVKDDPNKINSGSGRLWSYTSRISIPILSYCLLPIIIIVSNSKMRKTLKREILEFLK
jgi:hypothetical protein